jgi:hypothetical protein
MIMSTPAVVATRTLPVELLAMLFGCPVVAMAVESSLPFFALRSVSSRPMTQIALEDCDTARPTTAAEMEPMGEQYPSASYLITFPSYDPDREESASVGSIIVSLPSYTP